MRRLWREFTVVLLIAVTLSGAAARADTYWSAIATSCVAESAAIQSNRYANPDDTTSALNAANSDLVALVCGIPQNQLAQPPNVIGMTFRDSTAKTTSAQVRAKLIAISRTTGVRTQVAVVSSDSSAATSNSFRRSVQFTHAINFTANYYFMRIEIDRAISAEDVRSIGVTLESTCGNGAVTGIEQCDDGNIASADGCSNTCKVEAGFNCAGTPSVCTASCGDGIPAALEACDDNNLINGDGCSASCQIETGFNCTGTPSVCTAACGDGVVTAFEACDDGNAINGDGCASSCSIEDAYQCTGSPSVCSLVSGACIVASDCPGSDTECQTRTCAANACGLSFTANGTTVASQTAGDCKVAQCDGLGNIVAGNDDADLPDDGNQCTLEACTAGFPVSTAAPAGTACSTGGGTVCDGAGTCVAP